MTAERPLQETARLSAGEYPEVNQIVQNYIYEWHQSEICLSGEENIEKALQRADELQLVLNCDGFTLKAITFTAGDPTSALSANDSSVNVFEMKWLQKENLLAFEIGELNFSKKQHEKKKKKKKLKHENIIPSRLT